MRKLIIAAMMAMPSIVVAAGLLMVFERAVMSEADQVKLVGRMIAITGQHIAIEDVAIATNTATAKGYRVLNLQKEQADKYGVNASNQTAWCAANLDSGTNYVQAYDTNDPADKLSEIGIDLLPMND